MKCTAIKFVDSTNITFTDNCTTNFRDLYIWLTNDSKEPFTVVNNDNKNFILYKHAIKYVEVY